MRGRRFWLSYVLLVFLALLLRPPARSFLFVNEAINATVAQQVVMGGKLYQDAADWKGPLGYLIYAAVLRATNFSLVGIHIFGLLTVLGLMACAGGIARLAAGPGAEVPAAALTLVYLAHTLGPSVEADLFMVAFSAAGYLCFAAFLLAKRSRPLLAVAAGFLLVMALSCKQVAALDLVALGLGGLLLTRKQVCRRRAWRGIGLLLIGVGLGLATSALLVARYSTFHDYVAWTWIIPAVGQKAEPSQWLRAWTNLLAQAGSGPAILWGLGLAAAVYFAHNFWRTPSHESQPALAVSGLLLPLWLAAAIIGVMAGIFPLPYHYTQVAAPLSILAAVGLTCCLKAHPAAQWRKYLGAVGS